MYFDFLCSRATFCAPTSKTGVLVQSLLRLCGCAVVAVPGGAVLRCCDAALPDRCYCRRRSALCQRVAGTHLRRHRAPLAARRRTRNPRARDHRCRRCRFPDLAQLRSAKDRSDRPPPFPTSTNGQKFGAQSLFHATAEALRRGAREAKATAGAYSATRFADVEIRAALPGKRTATMRIALHIIDFSIARQKTMRRHLAWVRATDLAQHQRASRNNVTQHHSARASPSTAFLRAIAAPRITRTGRSLIDVTACGLG